MGNIGTSFLKKKNLDPEFKVFGIFSLLKLMYLYFLKECTILYGVYLRFLFIFRSSFVNVESCASCLSCVALEEFI